MLLLNLPYALANDVEIRLWKGVFYKVIEDFRRRSKAVSGIFHMSRPFVGFQC